VLPVIPEFEFAQFPRLTEMFRSQACFAPSSNSHKLVPRTKEKLFWLTFQHPPAFF
jgi:hypothetical protein